MNCDFIQLKDIISKMYNDLMILDGDKQQHTTWRKKRKKTLHLIIPPKTSLSMAKFEIKLKWLLWALPCVFKQTLNHFTFPLMAKKNIKII